MKSNGIKGTKCKELGFQKACRVEKFKESCRVEL